MTTLADRAETVPVDALGKAGQDPRTAEEYARDLERETAVSLRQDPSRWPWRTSSEVLNEHRHRQRTPVVLAEAGPGRCRSCGTDLGGRRVGTRYCSGTCAQRGARADREATTAQEPREAASGSSGGGER